MTLDGCVDGVHGFVLDNWIVGVEGYDSTMLFYFLHRKATVTNRLRNLFQIANELGTEKYWFLRCIMNSTPVLEGRH